MNNIVLLEMIKKFMSGEDRSITKANELEVALDDAFPNDEYVQDTVLMLASYRPGGGEYLYDQDEINKRSEIVLEQLKSLP